MAEKRKLKAVYLFPVIAGCGLVGAGLGVCVNTIGIFFTPIANELAIGRGRASMLMTVYCIVQAVGGFLSPSLLRRFGIKKLIYAGSFVQIACTILLSVCRSIHPMYALNALRGFASGVIGTVPVTIMINYWFRERVGLMTSIAMGFSGLVGAALSPVIAGIIAAAGWRAAMASCAGWIFLLDLPALVLPLAVRPEDRGLTPYGRQPEQASVPAEGETGGRLYPPLVILTLAFAMCCSLTTAMPAHFPGIAEWRMHPAVGPAMLSVSMVSNTGGKVALGWLVDRVGTRKAASLFLVLIAAGALCLFFAGVPALLCGAALYGLCYSAATLAASTLSREMFGVENYGRAYPRTVLAGTATNAVSASVIGFLYDSSGSYRGALLLMLTALALALLIVHTAYIIKAKKNRRTE